MPWLLSLFGVKKNADSLLAQYCFGDLVDTAPQVLKSPDCYFLSLLGLPFTSWDISLDSTISSLTQFF